MGNLLPDMPLMKVIEKRLNWMIFKDTNLNIRNNIIYFLKIIGMFHPLTSEKTLLYCSNSGLHRISLKYSGESN